jgi:hypothetical protein
MSCCLDERADCVEFEGGFMTSTRRSLVTILLALGFVLPATLAAQRSSMTDADRQAILAYPLTLPRANELIAAMQEMTKYMLSRPDFADVMARSMKMTRAEQIAQMERDPKAMAIVTQHGLGGRDYAYGVPALRMALMAAQGLTAPTVIASPANVAFAKANLAELKPKMDAVDQLGARR